VIAVALILGLPFTGALLLALVRAHRRAAQLNCALSLATLAGGAALFTTAPETSAYFLVDEFNIYLIVLTAFVGFTTSLFSAGYIQHEIDTGRLNARYLRFYHAMYQGFMFSMLLALVSNNLGIMWIAVEAATLTTTLMVSLYRTHEAIEAAWKYFILCGVGLALALFGTILLYFAAQAVLDRPPETDPGAMLV
jgi:hydrogenase-4 component F